MENNLTRKQRKDSIFKTDVISKNKQSKQKPCLYEVTVRG